MTPAEYVRQVEFDANTKLVISCSVLSIHFFSLNQQALFFSWHPQKCGKLNCLPESRAKSQSYHSSLDNILFEDLLISMMNYKVQNYLLDLITCIFFSFSLFLPFLFLKLFLFLFLVEITEIISVILLDSDDSEGQCLDQSDMVRYITIKDSAKEYYKVQNEHESISLTGFIEILRGVEYSPKPIKSPNLSDIDVKG